MRKRQENAARRILDCGQITAADFLIKTYSVTVIILLRSLLHRVGHFFGSLRLILALITYYSDMALEFC
jgi:hypothetical protein